MAPSAPPRATARTWCGLAVLLLPALLTSMDISVLFVAGPAIAETLHLTSTQWLWAMDIYGFVMAGLLITMGGLGDRAGRRRLLLIGAAAFGVASTLLAYAPSAELLILGRALLAIGGATLAPSTLSLIRGMFHDADQRRIAVGAWTVAFAGGGVAGPIIGGALLEYFWWGAVFLINVPAMLLLLIAAPHLVGESKDPARTRFDLPGAALSLVAILSLVHTMKDLVQHGFGRTPAISALLGIVATAAFLARQRRTAYPLIELGLFRIRAFAAAVGANTVVAMVTAGLGVLVFPFLQTVHGLTPLQSALWALPTLAGSFLGAATAAALANRLPTGPLLCAGLLACAAGLGVVGTVEPGTALWVFLAGYSVLIFGCGIAATLANSAILGSAPPRRAGMASGLSETSNELGAALGIAVFGTVAAAVYRSSMTANAPASTDPSAMDTLAGAVASAREHADADPATLLELAHAAYTDGLAVTAYACAGLAFVVAVTAAVVLRGRRT